MIHIFKLVKSDWERYLNRYNKMNFLLFLAVWFNNPGMTFSVIFRIEHALITNEIKILKWIGLLFYPVYFVLTYYILDINISPFIYIGKGLYLHLRGIVIGGDTYIGDNCTLIGPLTIGVKRFGFSGKGPKMGKNVEIYSGAKIFGDITIKNNVIIGGNAVVVKDIPANVIVGGVPAKIIKKISKP